MGITAESAKFLLYCKSKGVSFNESVMLGRQQLFIDQNDSAKLGIKWNFDFTNIPLDAYAEPLFSALGSSVIDSIDQSDYENATIIHDLGKPIPDNLKSRYTTVFDGGTLEHVFNFPQAIKNCMDLLKIGGHFIAITPANNYFGHGFYQFSPELYFSLLGKANGFKVKLIAISVEEPGVTFPAWYEVMNPAIVKRRVTLSNAHPTTMYVMAEKLADMGATSPIAFQSDYENIWKVYSSLKEDKAIPGEKRWVHYYRTLTPDFIKNIVRGFAGARHGKEEHVQEIGFVNSEFFKKLDV